MNDNRMKRWMDAIDDDLLEEAQRPLPRGGAARRWGTLAACFCAAALALALWQPWSAGNGDNTAGADADFGAMDKSFSVAMPPVLDAEPLSASLALPEGASLTSDYRWRQDGEGAVTGVSCTVLLDGYDYDYGAAYASQPLPAPDGTLPTDTWQVNGLTLLVYDDGAVGWYDTSAGIQWYCAAWDGGEPLVTAFTLMDAQYYTVPTAPEGADVLGYDLFDLDGATVTEVAFTLNSVTWHYRMAPHFGRFRNNTGHLRLHRRQPDGGGQAPLVSHRPSLGRGRRRLHHLAGHRSRSGVQSDRGHRCVGEDAGGYGRPGVQACPGGVLNKTQKAPRKGCFLRHSSYFRQYSRLRGGVIFAPHRGKECLRSSMAVLSELIDPV